MSGGQHSPFYFDYFDGKQLHEAAADDGLEFPSTEAAYLEAFKAAAEMWGEAIRERRNPTLDYFRVRDQYGVVILELPFTEVLESCRGGVRRPGPVRIEDLGGTVFSAGTDPRSCEARLAQVEKARKMVANLRVRVGRLKELGRDTEMAECTLDAFVVALITFEDIVNSIQAIEERVSLTSAGGPTPRSGDVATRPTDAAIEWGELIG